MYLLENDEQSDFSHAKGIQSIPFCTCQSILPFSLFKLAQPVETYSESETEEMVLSLPENDLQPKRAKTKVEEFSVGQKKIEKKPKKQENLFK